MLCAMCSRFRLLRLLLIGECVLAFSATAEAKTTKLPAVRTTPTGNFITLESFTTSGKTADAEVKVCTSAHTPKDTAVDPYFFTLRLNNKATVAIMPVAAKSPSLRLTPLGADKCLEGWISFAVPATAKPAQLVYTYGAPISWNVS
jgi:hypothetical protein